MKKSFKKVILTAVCACMMAFTAVGCGGDSGSDTGNNAQTGQIDKAESLSGYYFATGGTNIYVNQKMEDVLSSLGEPVQYFESESCAYQGMDKTYTYNSFIIKTYPENDVDYVLSVSLRDDTVQTPEGIAIGSSKSDVTTAYGAGEESGSALVYTKDQSRLTIIFDGDSVTSIEYSAVQ